MSGGEDDLVRIPAQLLSEGRILALRLYAALRTVRIHGHRNEAFKEASSKLRSDVHRLLPFGGGKLDFRLDRDAILLNGAMVRSTAQGSEQLAELHGLLAALGVGGLRFEGEDAGQHLERWLEIFETALGPSHADEAWARFEALRAHGLRTLTPERLTEDRAPVADPTRPAFAVQTYARAEVAFAEFVEALRAGRDPFAGRLNVVRVVQDLVDVVSGHPEHLLALLSSRPRGADQATTATYAPRHAAGVCAFSLLLGSRLGLARLELLDLGTAALLAKVGAALAASPASEVARPLSAVERADLHRATSEALEAVIAKSRLSEAMLRRVVVAYEHAEPPRRGRAHPFSRIVAVADAFDAMISDRPWRPALAAEEALGQLRADRRVHDPVVVETLATLLSPPRASA